MNITELRDKLNQLIDAGHGKELLWDNDNPEFALVWVITKDMIDGNGDQFKRFYLDLDEVKL